MLKQIVENYSIITPLSTSDLNPRGASACPQNLIFHILNDNSQNVEILDIGFGTGNLGSLIKHYDKTAHWHVDGIDGFQPNCNNTQLFDQKIYRNVWHGLAQQLPSDLLRKYKIICLLDVIEHLSSDTAKWLLRTLLTSMGDESFLFISTPLWFWPQNHIQHNDLEEHLIGIPATSMMALMPTMYAVNHPLVGGFVFGKRSLDFIEFFQPTSDKNFSYERGVAIAEAIKFQHTPGTLIKL
ncbi:class I SAM-dependent methyltransferase [Trinickia violacea]|uniref:Class I SAM-dependent methyltransferase n=1 Tax=Trinickia violacea TaxID=2571746 RepID=A0A4P8IT97_9BURK|nr:methyltransferase domain-containing protein [Trinickia violacea]QCP50985.1 class I SAM-dependent methyltransferase [Trinickia violacea]